MGERESGPRCSPSPGTLLRVLPDGGAREAHVLGQTALGASSPSVGVGGCRREAESSLSKMSHPHLGLWATQGFQRALSCSSVVGRRRKAGLTSRLV